MCRSANVSTRSFRLAEHTPTRAQLDRYGWRDHCRGLFQIPVAAYVAGVVNPPKNGDEPRAENRHTAHHGQPSKAVTACRIKRILLIRQEKSSLGKRLVRRVSISYARFPRNPRNTRVPNTADSLNYEFATNRSLLYPHHPLKPIRKRAEIVGTGLLVSRPILFRISQSNPGPQIRATSVTDN